MTSAFDAGSRILTDPSSCTLTSFRQHFPSSTSLRSHQHPIFIALAGCSGPARARDCSVTDNFAASPEGNGAACAAGPMPLLTALCDLPHCLCSAGVQGQSFSMWRNLATLATVIVDRNLAARSTLMFLQRIAAVSSTGFNPEAAKDTSSHNSSWFRRTFACPDECTFFPRDSMAFCNSTIAVSLEPLAYEDDGGPSPLLVISSCEVPEL